MQTRFRLACAMVALGLLAVTPVAQATPILSEGFDNIATLSGAGWVLVNNSSPLGTTGWFQGNSGVFTAQTGAPDSYIAANFNNAGLGGNISNWLITPELSLNNGDTLTFWTRGNGAFADRLELRLSTNGLSTNVGSTDTSVGDFATLLLTINPALAVPGYPDAWTSFSVTVSGLDAPANGRYAFRYFVPDTSVNADYIGIDTVSVEPVPEPGTLLLMTAGGLALFRRRRHN